ncbi:MAG: hypothetical protein ACSHXB_16125 [Sulfitobacter sp.]
MTLYIDPAQIQWGEFGELEPPQKEWEEQFDYWRDYVEKFFLSNGMKFEPGDSNVEQWLMAPDRAPFSEMIKALLPKLSKTVDLSETEAILFSHWLPDLHMGTSVTNFTMHELGLKNCFGFAISDRGLSAPFFAFDTLYKYLTAKNCSGLLLIADQKHLLYKSKLVDDLKPSNAAAILRLDPSIKAGLEYRGYKRTSHGADAENTTLVAGLLDHFELQGDRATVIGPNSLLTDTDVGNAQIKITRDAYLCAAPFAALVDDIDQTRDHLLLCRDDNHVTALAFKGDRS